MNLLVNPITLRDLHKNLGHVAGNDDYGTMSSWLIWAMAGVYPVTGTDTYVLGSPVFSRFSLTVPSLSGASADRDECVLNISVHNSSSSNIYVTHALLNKQPLKTPFVSHSSLTGCGNLEFFMTDVPTRWGEAAL